jgi:hypothetical protein
VQGLEAFNIVVTGLSFPVQRVDLDDFDFGGLQPVVQVQIQQVLQVTAGEYILQLLPDRFQITAIASQPSGTRLDVLRGVALKFITDYTTKNTVIAIGHNFTGSFASAIGSATDFMKHIAWRDDFAAAIGAASDPTLSLTTTVAITGEETRNLRLEPRPRDNTRVYYDLNFNWGQPDKPLQVPSRDVLDRYRESLKLGADLIERLAALGAAQPEGRTQ